MTPEELKTILDKHAKYLRGEDGGERADLRGADLSGAHLSGADLSGAHLRGAHLRGADLSGAHLSGAYLSYADLSYADLSGADLGGAHLSGAHLRGAYLRGAHLRGAVPRWAIKLQIVPQVGAFTAFKRCGDWIVELAVTETARRVGGLTERKCRVSEAVVKSITGRSDKEKTSDVVCSDYDTQFIYRAGETVRVENFCDDIREVCAAGIHCYLTREEAEDHT